MTTPHPDLTAARDEAVYRALLMLTGDTPRPAAPHEFVRLLEQDGYTVRGFARAEAGVSVEALHRDHHPVPYHWSQSGERGTVCAGSLVGLHHRVELWPCDVERAIQTALALARAEAGVSLEEMGKAWAAVEAALPEHHYFKVEHDSDDDPSWYLAVWRSDGIFPDPIRWAQADTLLDGLTRLALELRTPR